MLNPRIEAHREQRSTRRRRTRRKHAGGFTAKVALTAMKVEKTMAEMDAHFDVHPNQILEWKQQLLESAG